MHNPIKLQLSQLVGPGLVFLSLALHLFIVWTIAKQPLDVNSQPASQRSVVWPLYNDTIHRQGPGADFFAVYHAGQALQRGISLYADDPQSRIYYYFPFRYLPIVAQTLGSFFIQFSPIVAYRVWILILEAMLACFLGVFARHTLGWLKYFGVCVLLLSTPYFLELHMGQFTFMTASLLAIGLLLYEGRGTGQERMGWIGAITYLAAVLLKIFPLITAPAFVRKKTFWLPLGLAVVFGLVVSVPYFVTHPGEFGLFYARNFVSIGGLDSGNFGFVYLAYLSAKFMKLSAVLDHWDIAAGLWRLCLLALTSLVVLFNKKNLVSVGAVAMILAHFLSYPEVWEHHISAVLVVGVLLLVVIYHEESSARVLIWLTVASLVLLALPTPFALFDQMKDPKVWNPFVGAPLPVSFLLVLTKAFPTGLLYLVCLTTLSSSGFTRTFIDVKTKSLGPLSPEKEPIAPDSLRSGINFKLIYQSVSHLHSQAPPTRPAWGNTGRCAGIGASIHVLSPKF